MTQFTDEQAEHARDLLERYTERAEKHETLFEQGKVEESLSSFFRGLGQKYEKAAILRTHFAGAQGALENFGIAAERYLRSGRENDSVGELYATLSYSKALYAGALGGDRALLHETAGEITSIVERHDVEPGDPYDDRFYLAANLADAVETPTTGKYLEGLQAVNRDKPEHEALYGRAIIEFVTGARDDDTELLEQGIRTMLEYHDRDRHEDDVLDMVMSVQASALYVIARYLGYSVDVESDFLPDELLEASLDALD